MGLAANALLFAAVRIMTEGLSLNFGAEAVSALEITLFLFLLIANRLTVHSMDTGAATFFGYHFATDCQSMAVIGFIQTPSFLKWMFPFRLSHKSRVRTFLGLLSVVWLVLELLKIATVLGATSITYDLLRFDAFTVNCLQFGQNGSPVDRKFPDIEAEIGLAELVFGKSLGRLRSEESVDTTTIIVGPQLTGVVNDDDTIVGEGYTIDIATSCHCAQKADANTLLAASTITPYEDGSIFAYPDATGADNVNISMISSVGRDMDANTVTIRSVILNSPLCWEVATPVCETTLSNHNRASIMVKYMTDGTTASIAQKFSMTRKVLEAADVTTWAYAAMQSVLGATPVEYPLTPTIPGMMTPILWWTTSDLTKFDVTLVEAGLETFYGILFRAGVQRSYSTDGSTCVRNIVDESRTLLVMDSTAALALTICIAVQFFSGVLALVMCAPWFFSQVPTGPAIRALKDMSYFATLLADSNLGEGLKGLCNAPTGAIWRALDTVVQIGETVATKDEEYGHITMDKPELVNVMINARKYL